MGDPAAFASRSLPEPYAAEAGGRAIAWREAGSGPALVLLHGIGSGSQSWHWQLADLSDAYRVIAWDAPGYGGSDPLPGEAPSASHYARALSELLRLLEIGRAHIVGHSLGAMMAAAFCRYYAPLVGSVTLAAPAAGYGSADDATREKRLAARMHMIDVLGPEGMARERGHVLLSPDASPEALEAVREAMRGLNPHGYRQAARMLCAGDIFADLSHVSAPAQVLCGTADTVTPEGGCRRIAAALLGAAYHSLPGLGHACQVEDPEAFNRALRAFLEEHR